MWRRRRGIIHLVILKQNKILSVHLYVQQLQPVYKCLVEKRPTLVNRKMFFAMSMQVRKNSTGKIEIWLISTI